MRPRAAIQAYDLAQPRERAQKKGAAAAHPPPSGTCAGSGIAHAVISIIIGLAGILTACSSTTATCTDFCKNDLGSARTKCLKIQKRSNNERNTKNVCGGGIEKKKLKLATS